MMKQLLHYFFITSFSLSLLAAGTITGRIVGVTDGDTVKILTAEKREIKVRLYGIDAPEKAQDFGQTAKKFTSDIAFGKEASVEFIDSDRYGREVGIVRVGDGPSVNEQLVAAGLAWRYPQYCKLEPLCATLDKLEQEARTAKRGLWADPDPAAPWQWRKDMKDKRNNRLKTIDKEQRARPVR